MHFQASGAQGIFVKTHWPKRSQHNRAVVYQEAQKTNTCGPNVLNLNQKEEIGPSNGDFQLSGQLGW